MNYTRSDALELTYFYMHIIYNAESSSSYASFNKLWVERDKAQRRGGTVGNINLPVYGRWWMVTA